MMLNRTHHIVFYMFGNSKQKLIRKIRDRLSIEVEDVRVSGKTATLIVQTDKLHSDDLPREEADLKQVCAGIKGVDDIRVVFTSSREAQQSLAGHQPIPVSRKSAPSKQGQKIQLPVKNIIAVASGKGGVGKSTVAANLAVYLAQKEMAVGLVDADIYGPSMPKMFNVETYKPEEVDGKIKPVETHGVKVMSIGFMVDTESPLIWRGPMVQGAVKQFLSDVAWQGCDTLIIDLPPGTGDAQLTLAQSIEMTGAVIVSTPQDIALIDARKAIAMFQKLNVPILGVVENMSTYCCPSCGHEEHIFDHGRAEDQAKESGVPFLGSLPLNIEIRTGGDNGQPDVLNHHERWDAIFGELAQSLQ